MKTLAISPVKRFAKYALPAIAATTLAIAPLKANASERMQEDTFTLFNESDKNKDNVIDVEESIDWVLAFKENNKKIKHGHMYTAEKLFNLIRSVDENKDKKVDKLEYEKLNACIAESRKEFEDKQFSFAGSFLTVVSIITSLIFGSVFFVKAPENRNEVEL